MKRSSTHRIVTVAAAMLVAATFAVALFAAFRDTIAGRALAAPAAELPFWNDNFDSPGMIWPQWSPPGATTLPWDGGQATAGATLEPGESAPCGNIGATVWFLYEPDHLGTLEITTTGSDFDTILAVYTTGNGFLPSPPGGNLNAVACNDDAGGATARVSFPLSGPSQFYAWERYYIQVGGKGGATGNLRLHIECNPACPPSNDDWSRAAHPYVDAYTPSMTLFADTTHATLEADEPRPCGAIGATVWYQLYADQDVTLVADTFGSGFDTVLAVYRPSDFALPSPPGGGFVPIACNDNAGGAQSKLTVAMKAQTSYWFQAGGADGATGALTFNIACDPACPPYNNSFQTREYLGLPAEISVPTTEATLEAGEPQPCGNIGASVWYEVQVYGDGSVVADTAGSEFDTVVAVYEPGPEFDYTTPGGLRSIGCAGGSGGQRARLAFHASANSSYFLQVGGRNGATGQLYMKADCDPSPCPPRNDNTSGSEWVAVPDYFPFNTGDDLRGATSEPGEPLDCGDMTRTAWYTITSSVHATLAFDTAGSDFDAAIAVYAPDAFSPPGDRSHRIACGAVNNGRVQFEMQANTTVYLQVGGVAGAGGNLQLHGDCLPACPPRNDNIASAAGYWPDTVRTTAATLEPGEPQPPCGDIGATVWYQLRPFEDGTARVHATDADFQPVIAVYRADGVSPPGSLTALGCAGPSQDASLDFDVTAYSVYYVQVGGAGGAGGTLTFSVECGVCGGGSIGGPDTGGPYGYGGRGAIALPSTGNGGYLPGSH